MFINESNLSINLCKSIFFQSLFCKLNKNYSNKNRLQLNCWISAFISGFGYLFFPKYMIFTMGITSCIETFFCNIKNSSELENQSNLSKFVKLIDKIPISYFLFIIGTSLSVQLRIIYPSLVNKYVHRVSDIVTNGKASEKIEHFLKYIMGVKS